MRRRHEQHDSKLHVFVKPRPMKLGYDFNGNKVKSNKASANPKQALEEMVDIVRQKVISEDYDLMTSLFEFVGKKKFDKKFVYDEIHKNGFDIDPVIRFTEVKKKDRITQVLVLRHHLTNYVLEQSGFFLLSLHKFTMIRHAAQFQPRPFHSVWKSL